MSSPTSDQRKLELVVQSGLLLAQNLDLQTVVQAATDVGRELCEAQFGAFFYNVINEKGESYALYTLSGVEREKFSKFPMPRNTAVFGPTFEGKGVVRSGDITKDERYGKNAPHHGMPEGHLPVRSYLAIPVKAKSGEVLGGLFYGHEKSNVFGEETERFVAMVATQAAIAIENVRLREQLTWKIADMERSELDQRAAARRIADLAAIVESSDDVILSKDCEGQITSWNEAATRVLGFSKEEAIGRPIFDLIPAEFHEDERDILAKIRSGQKIEHYETVRRTRDGHILQFDLGVSPVYDNSGNVVGVSSIMRDLTKRKHVERALLQAEKLAAASRMAATIAHEVNNPLESVLNLLYLIESNSADPAQVIAYSHDAQTELMRAAHIAKQTLGFYREHTSAALTSVVELVADAVRIYEPRCKAASIRIESSFHSSIEIVLRRGEMMQVISNVVTNAIHAMPSGGVLSLSVEDASQTDQRGVRLTIEDTGTGISPEYYAQLFEPFFTTRNGIGTGIGLFIARQFIEGHGGTIRFESSTDAAQHGTRFVIFLPDENQYSSSDAAGTNGMALQLRP